MSTASRAGSTTTVSSGSRSGSSGQDLVDRIQEADPQQYTSDVIDFLEGAAFSIFELLFSLVLIVVVSIYMLLDMDRLARGIDRRFPPAPGSQPLLRRVEGAVAGYVKGQALVSLIIGASAGRRALADRDARLGRGTGRLRAAVRLVGRGGGADPLPRPVARRDPADHLRAHRRPGLGASG